MDHRTSYRVQYPLGYPPRLMPRVMLEHAEQPPFSVELEDWSEQGMRIRMPHSLKLTVGDHVKLAITLPEEEPIGADATIVWTDVDFAAIQLASSTLPWRILLNEQRAIARWRTRLIEVKAENGNG